MRRPSPALTVAVGVLAFGLGFLAGAERGRRRPPVDRPAAVSDFVVQPAFGTAVTYRPYHVFANGRSELLAPAPAGAPDGVTTITVAGAQYNCVTVTAPRP